MRKILRIIGRIVGLTIAAAIVVLVTIEIAIVAMVPALLNPDNLKSGLERQNVYEDLMPIVLPAFTNTNPQFQGVLKIDDLRDNLSPGDWRAVTSEIMPPDWLQEQVEGVIDGIFAYLNGDEVIQYDLDTESLRARLTGEPGSRAIERIVALARPCTGDDIAQIRSFDPDAPDANVPVCSPANAEDADRLREQLALGLSQLAQQISEDEGTVSRLAFGPFSFREQIAPDGSARLDLDFSSGEEAEATQAARIFYQSYDYFGPIFIYAPLALLSLIVAITVRSPRGLLRWSGWTAMASSILTLFLLTILIIDLVQVPQAQDAANPNLPPELLQLQERLTNGIFSAVMSQAGETMGVWVGGLFIVGGVMLLLSLVVPGPRTVITIDETSLRQSDTIPQGQP